MCLGVTQISRHKENKISLIAADGVFCFDFQFSSNLTKAEPKASGIRQIPMFVGVATRVMQ